MSLIQKLQIAGYPSVSNSGNPATGAGLLGTCQVEYHSDGSLVITNSVGARIRVEEDGKVNNLLDLILKGTNGLTTNKIFIKAS